MKNLFSKILFFRLMIFSFGTALFAGVNPAYAQWAVTCVNCSNLLSQMLQYGKEVETAAISAQQLETQIQQYQSMVRQGLSLPQSLFSQITSNLAQIQSLYNQSSAVAGNIANFENNFSTKFPGYNTYLTNNGQNPAYVQDFYKQWAQNGLDSNKAAMGVAGTNVNQIQTEDSQLASLINQSQSAAGQLQAIQAANQIAAQQVQQMQKLRELVNAQIQNEGNYYAQAIQRQAIDDAATAAFYSGTVNRSGAKGY
ncbi:Conjugal transfer protein trbj [Granulibacter bethesdensis]|uniref:P-type conjugative transfer protein TrbJ n=1 Tax=Granulibacter bethesdensis TaxID=364410 RepID=UPI00090CCAD1|nr:P-type conjugative transfer protein TrbJ [Granulibacter bethesdensis]APH57193.1 Conjugal transfer protein trbj [Granulibacter bethesdensis]